MDSLADRILSLLPHCPADSNDVCVDMGPITAGSDDCTSNGDRKSRGVGGGVGSSSRIVHGSLAQPGSAKAQQLLKTLIQSKQKVNITFTKGLLISSCLYISMATNLIDVLIVASYMWIFFFMASLFFRSQ